MKQARCIKKGEEAYKLVKGRPKRVKLYVFLQKSDCSTLRVVLKLSLLSRISTEQNSWPTNSP